MWIWQCAEYLQLHPDVNMYKKVRDGAEGHFKIGAPVRLCRELVRTRQERRASLANEDNEMK
jgi:hypothetical protein